MTIIYVFVSVYSYLGVLKQLKGHVKQTAIGVSLIKGKKEDSNKNDYNDYSLQMIIIMAMIMIITIMIVINRTTIMITIIAIIIQYLYLYSSNIIISYSTLLPLFSFYLSPTNCILP